MKTSLPRRSSPVALALLVSLGCRENATTPPILESVVVEPTAARVLDPGDSVRFGAVGVFSDRSRAAVEGAWSTDDGAVAQIDARGWAVARSTGATVIQVTFEGKEGRASLVVHPDTTPPTLVDVFAAQTTVSLSIGPVVVPVMARFRDEGSSVRSVVGLFDGPLGAGITGLITFTADSVEATPDGAVSVYTGTLGIPGLIGVGRWTLSALRADDVVGNSRRWGAQELESRGLAVQVTALTSGGG